MLVRGQPKLRPAGASDMIRAGIPPLCCAAACGVGLAAGPALSLAASAAHPALRLPLPLAQCALFALGLVLSCTSSLAAPLERLRSVLAAAAALLIASHTWAELPTFPRNAQFLVSTAAPLSLSLSRPPNFGS